MNHGLGQQIHVYDSSQDHHLPSYARLCFTELTYILKASLSKKNTKIQDQLFDSERSTSFAACKKTRGTLRKHAGTQNLILKAFLVGLTRNALRVHGSHIHISHTAPIVCLDLCISTTIHVWYIYVT